MKSRPNRCKSGAKIYKKYTKKREEKREKREEREREREEREEREKRENKKRERKNVLAARLRRAAGADLVKFLYNIN